MKQRQPIRTTASIVLMGLAFTAAAQEGVQRAQEHLRMANLAYASKDFAAQAAQLETALDLNPASLRIRYNLACAYALHGDQARALEMLGQLADLGVGYGMADDSDLRSLRDTRAFETLLARLERNARPMINSRRLATIEEFGLIPEGIAHDGTTGRTFFGSMRNGDIYVLDGAGRLSRFAAIGVPGFSAVGLAVDERRRMLWAIGTATEFAADATGKTGTATETVAADPSETPTQRPGDRTGIATKDPGTSRAGQPAAAAARTGIFGFDLSSGKASAHALADPSVEGFNDVTVAPNGDLYLSGSRLSVVAAESSEILPLRTSPVLVGTNGIVVSRDGTRLFTSVYPVGIATVDLVSGQARFLSLPENATLYGIDGLYLHGDDLIAIQNGTEPWRLLRIELDDRQRGVTAIRVLERDNPYMTATTGAITGNEIIFIGQGPAPDAAPPHVPESLVPFFGQTLIMAAPLD